MVRLSSSRVFTVMSSTVSLVFFISTLNILIYDEEKETNQKVNISVKSKRDVSTSIKKEIYFELLPNTNWTLFDIRRGKQSSGKKEIIGIDNDLDPSSWDNLHEINPSDTNRSSLSHIVIYNRVPKCASSTMIALIKLLTARNSFNFISSQIYWR